ncbi:MAG: ABC transporter permease [Wenzhouxiangellaceae bacterium]
MIVTVAKVMWLAVWRDRGTLMLAFVLPPLMFLIFAEVFSGAGDSDLKMRVALLDSAQTPLTRQIVDALAELDGIEPVAQDLDSDRSGIAGLEALVRQGRADAAVWVRAEPDGNLDTEPAIVVIGDASRGLAAAIVTGRVQRLLQAGFPQLGIQRAAARIAELAGPYTEQQRKALDLALSELDSAGLQDRADSDIRHDGLVAQRLLGGGRQVDDGVSYYAGAVAILFLLFAAMQGAISLIDERNSGIVDRLVAGPGGYTVVVVGKGLFLTLQGLAQAGLIFAVAWWMYGIDWIGRFGSWLVTAFLAAAVSAWLGLLLASLCRTRQQAQTASAFVVLILSAIGGSMMPRFLMPGWLRELGWFTPNAWVIESWHGMFWRGDGPAELANGWGVLLATALVAMLISVWLAHRLAREK